MLRGRLIALILFCTAMNFNSVQHCLVQMLTQDFGTGTDWNLGRFWCRYRLNLLAAVSIFQNLGGFFTLSEFQVVDI